MLAPHAADIAKRLSAELVVIAPAHNEGEGIAETLGGWIKTLTPTQSYQILLLNDGSTDGTQAKVEKIQREHASEVVLVNKPNEGYGPTCRLGYEAASLAPNTKWVLQIDTDGQCAPSDFYPFWAARNLSDCLLARRQRPSGMRHIGTNLTNRVVSALTGLAIGDANAPFRLIKKDVLTEILKRVPPRMQMINIGITVAIKQDPRISWEEIPISFPERTGGGGTPIWKLSLMTAKALIDVRKICPKS